MASTPAKKRAPRRSKRSGNGRAAEREFERHPVDAHAGQAPAGPPTKLTRGPARAFSATSSRSSRSTPTRPPSRWTATWSQHAFVFACERHADQRRASGEDFIVHPVGVAKICAGMRLDTATLCAALLHDTVEDTSASLDEVRASSATRSARSWTA